MAAQPEIDKMKDILEWIGSTNQSNRTSIIGNAFSTYTDIQTLAEKDITELSESFSGPTAQNYHIKFGICRTKQLKHTVHWVQDFYRVSIISTTDGLKEADFLSALTVTGKWADVCKLSYDQSDKKAKVASPGSLVSENKWVEWEPKFINYLSILIGMNGIPLSYVINENDTPDRTTTQVNLIEEYIACTHFNGVNYQSDCSAIHQVLLSFTTGHPSENWIKSLN